jgi:hypothetical protein
MGKNVFFAIIRWITALALAAVLFLFASSEKISNADFDSVCAAVEKQLDLTQMQRGSDSVFRRLYSLDSADYDGVMLYWPVSNMDAEELLIIRLKDVSQQDEIRAAVEKRLATQKKSFDGYGAEQYELLTDFSVLDTEGNYVLFVVGRDCDKVEKAFRDAL